MNETLALLDLPVPTMAALAAGYVAYRIAYKGHDEAHGTVDIVFISLIFAAIARLYTSTAPPGVVSILLGFALAVGAASFWRRAAAQRVFVWMSRVLQISHADRTRTALGSVLATAPVLTQIVIRKRNGDALMSSPLIRFDQSPVRSCVLGADGSVAMFVTAYKPEGAEWVEVEPEVAGWGRRITVVPADQIAEIEIAS